MSGGRRSSGARGPGCAILLAVLVAAVVVRAFRAAPVTTTVVLGLLVIAAVLLVMTSVARQHARDAEAWAAVANRAERERLEALREVQRELAERDQDTHDDVRLVVNGWRITPAWLIEGRASDARRYSLAGLTAAHRTGHLVITGPGVAVAEKVGGSPAAYAAEIRRLAGAAAVAGPPVLPRRGEPYCACPAGHEGLHVLAATPDRTLIQRTCVEPGCAQTWREHT